MATISKFYFHDAATTNTGTMPGAGDTFAGGGVTLTGEGTGARTSRLSNDAIGTLQTSSLITANANVLAQEWGHRRFVSPPLAAHTFAAADGNWTFSYARSESNTGHNGVIHFYVSLWRPSTLTWLASGLVQMTCTAMSSTSEVADSVTGAALATVSVLDGDVLVFEVMDFFTQGMAVAYTSSFFYDGTTEASATSCASFVTPPAALTLFTAPVPATPLPLHQSVPFYPRASRPS